MKINRNCPAQRRGTRAKLRCARLVTLHQSLIVLVVLSLAACGPMATGLAPTPTSRISSTAVGSDTSEAGFNAQVIATASALHLTALAASPVPALVSTQPPDLTATSAPATVTAASPSAPPPTAAPVANTLTPSPTSGPVSTQRPTPLPLSATPPPAKPAILSFTVDRTKAQPGDKVTLTWATVGGVTASLGQGICCANNGADEMQSIPLNGSIGVSLDAVVQRDSINFWLVVENASGAATAAQQTDLPCPDTYFFSTSGAAMPCPAGPPASSPAAEELFEHGRMIWLKSTGAIYVLFGDGTPKPSGQPPDGFVQIQDTWKTGDPESDPCLVPPAGLFQPVRGFGKVWRDQERANLGWALGPEQAFDAVEQRPWTTCRRRDTATGAVVNCSSADGTHEYVKTADGRTILLTGFLNHTPQHWEWVTAP
jgi:hypothetical protein